ncbi:ABC transporter permease subunit, partial [bacterium]|nr:ABC transporter permease subunit [bacterium]
FLTMQDRNQLIRVAIVNSDHGDLANQFVNNLRSKEGLEATLLDSRDSALNKLDTDLFMAVIAIGPNFQKRVDNLAVADILYPDEGLLSGGLNSLDIEVICRGSFMNTEGIVRQLVFGSAVQSLAPYVTRKNRLAARIIDNGRATFGERRTAQEKSSPVKKASSPEVNGNVYQVLVPSYTVMFAFFLVNIMARSFISERDIGTLCRLRLAPISRSGLLLGKTIPFFIVSLVQSALLFVFGRVLFGMSWGTAPAGLIPVIVCTSLAATALGLLVATLARTESQVSAYGNFLVITMAGISGCFMPRNWQPQLMQKLGLITPHAWALIGYDQLLVQEHLNAAVIGRSCAMLLVFAAAFFAVGWWRFQTIDQPA